MTDEGIKLSDISKEGVKLNYSKVKKAILQCELDKKSSECKRMLKEIGVEDIFE